MSQKIRSGRRAHSILCKTICSWLKVMGIWYCRPEAQPIMVSKNGRTFPVGRVNAGVPDILAVDPRNGQLVGIEVKTGDGKLRDSQKQCRDHMLRCNARYIVARSLDDVIKEFKGDE